MVFLEKAPYPCGSACGGLVCGSPCGSPISGKYLHGLLEKSLIVVTAAKFLFHQTCSYVQYVLVDVTASLAWSPVRNEKCRRESRQKADLSETVFYRAWGYCKLILLNSCQPMEPDDTSPKLNTRSSTPWQRLEQMLTSAQMVRLSHYDEHRQVNQGLRSKWPLLCDKEAMQSDGRSWADINLEFVGVTENASGKRGDAYIA